MVRKLTKTNLLKNPLSVAAHQFYNIFFKCISCELTLADNPCCSCLATYFGQIPFASSSQPNNKVHLALT